MDVSGQSYRKLSDFPSGRLQLPVFSVLDLLRFTGFDGAGYLPPDGPQALADPCSDGFHVVRGEVTGQGGENHGDAEEAPGETVGAGGVTVSVDLLHARFFSGEKVVEGFRLRQRESERDLRCLLQFLGKGSEKLTGSVESLFKGSVAAVGCEAVLPLGRGVDAVEDEAGEEPVLGILDEGFDLLGGAGEDGGEAGGVDSAFFHPLFEMPKHGIYDFIFVFLVGEKIDEQAVLF